MKACSDVPAVGAAVVAVRTTFSGWEVVVVAVVVVVVDLLGAWTEVETRSG